MGEWTKERDERLLNLAKGGKTSNELSDIFGISRSAIMGRFHKLGIKISSLNGNVPPDKAKAKEKADKRRLHNRFKRRPPHRIKPQRLPAITVKENCTLMELTRASCRWPLWADAYEAKKLFCGARAYDKGPYCEAHALIAQHGSYKRRIDEPVPSLVTNTVPAKSPKSIA